IDLGITNLPIAGLSFSTRYYGFVLGNLGGGLSDDIPGKVASGWMPTLDYGIGRERHAHELAHILGRHHAVDSVLGLDPSLQKKGYCGEVATNVAPDFPNLFNVPIGRRPTLGPMDQGPNPMIWGLDFYSIFKNGPMFSQVVNPTNTHELMSYCRSATWPLRWVSSYTYTNLFNILASQFRQYSLFAPGGFAGTRALQAAQNAAADYLLFSGEIDVLQNSAVLSSVLRVRLSAPPPPTQGEYTLRLRDAVGTVLADILFTASLGEADDPENGPRAIAIFAIPVVADPAIRQVEVLHAGQVLATRKASANAPTINVLSPNGGEVLANDPVTLRWDAKDADGDPLTYLVQYSDDGGQSWQTLTLDWQQTSYTLSPDILRATQQGRIRVQASDGFNTGEDDSDNNFIVPNHPPKIGLVSPGENELVIGAQQIVLRASITDREDGSVSDDRVLWTSGIDGRLGSGNELFLSASSLSQGDHTITVSASDGNGATVTRTFPLRFQREATPQLQIEALKELIRITWPAALIEYELESSLNLRPASWTAMTGNTQVLRGMKALDLPTANAPRFFRLRKL
ncbi:MAG: fibronectin type III domain-containing protein, partial [Verrucomicrobiota bacterium]